MIRALFFFLISAACLSAQNPATAVFPSAAAVDTDLGVACNGSNRGSLTASVSSSALTMSVSDGTKFCYPSYATIDLETFKICSVSGNTVTVCSGQRGVHGTAAAHSSGAAISAYIDQNAMNQVAAEIKAVEKSILANGGVSVVDKGAVGDGVTADDSAFTAAFVAACAKTTGRMVVIPSPSNFYRLTATYDIPCDQIEIIGVGLPQIKYLGTGAMWTSSLLGIKISIHGLQVQGPSTANTYFFKIIGSGGLGLTNSSIYDNNITNFGDSATASGAGILVQADSPSLSVYRNIFNNFGTAFSLAAPADNLDFHDNYVVSASGYGADLNSATGAGTMLIRHNNFTTIRGAVRVGASVGGAVIVRDNEFEINSTLTDANSAAFDLLGGFITADGNSCTLHSHGNYCYWVDDAISYSFFSNNTGSGYNTANIKNGAGLSNLYLYNGSGSSPSGMYSNPNYPGIISIQAATSAPAYGFGTSNPVGGFQVNMPGVAYDAADWGLATFTDSASPARKLSIGYDGTREAGYVQAVKSGVDVMPLFLNPRGGGTKVGDWLQLSTKGTTSQPTCNSSAAGTIWYSGHSTGIKDGVAVCAADASNAYAWRTIY